jgi:hypothetical protein
MATGVSGWFGKARQAGEEARRVVESGKARQAWFVAARIGWERNGWVRL